MIIEIAFIYKVISLGISYTEANGPYIREYYTITLARSVDDRSRLPFKAIRARRNRVLDAIFCLTVRHVHPTMNTAFK